MPCTAHDAIRIGNDPHTAPKPAIRPAAPYTAKAGTITDFRLTRSDQYPMKGMNIPAVTENKVITRLECYSDSFKCLARSGGIGTSIKFPSTSRGGRWRWRKIGAIWISAFTRRLLIMNSDGFMANVPCALSFHTVHVTM